MVADTAVRNKIEKFQEDGFGNLPICIAKTQYSFSTDPKLRGAPSGHVFNVRDVYLNAGAGFMVVLSGDIMTMPGLPKKPASDNIDIDATMDATWLRFVLVAALKKEVMRVFRQVIPSARRNQILVHLLPIRKGCRSVL